MDALAVIILSVIGAVILLVIILKVISMMKGKIDINLSNFNFSEGDNITGKIILKLKKPVSAESLNVGLIAESSSRGTTIGIGGLKSNNSKSAIVFSFIQPLDGEKTYPAGETEYDFSLKVPRNAVPNATGNEIVDTIVKSAQILSGRLSSTKWYVTAELEVSGMNLSKKVQVNIS